MRRRYRILGMLAWLLCLASGSYALSPDSAQSVADSNQSPLPAPEAVHPNHDGVGDHGTELRLGAAEWGSIAERTTAAATVALALVTAVLAYYTYQLFKATSIAMRETRESIAISREALKATHESVDISRESLEVSRKQAALAEHALASIERPYLFVEKIEIDFTERTTGVGDDAVVRRSPKISYTIVNYGRVPAVVSVTWLRTKVRDQITELPDFSENNIFLADKPSETDFVIGADKDSRSFTIYPMVSISPEVFSGIKSGRGKLIFYGKIHYTDAGGRTFITGFGVSNVFYSHRVRSS